ncbi:P-loop containing nucleoside triphosphate hydrolase protein [Rhizopogon vinicolor AM-OR11-026]|uniref:p-loop containing nucleoside triphosphate hydrolase protein n=1 Tax=Rhizopogon vinicolor AM-OR11-026 TaxID=1314800 RepID=A0A1B7NHP0_9AGAM|nr:P-loop containing nucleoside triphosphate hydrolase protein [Rhizopogon vinicolor AM-OR11-026]
MVTRQKNQNPSGLGRAIINKKFKDARERQESGLYTTEVDSTTRLKSVTQERDLDEFLNTAQLAGTEFTAERRNVKIIQSPAGSTHNPHLLTDQEEQSTLKKHQQNKERLRVPRRPAWTKSITTAQLDRQEKDAFLEWRRGLAHLQEEDKFLLTPFERNLEVWRQLWRVLERSHLVVQIVDARNPLGFRCDDLESYVKDVEGAEGEAGTGRDKRKSLLLINKSDLLTATQRRIWADYFDSQGIQYAFFSAANAAALQQARRDAIAEAEETRLYQDAHRDEASLSDSDGPHTPRDDDSDDDFPEKSESESQSASETDYDHEYVHTEEDSPDGKDPRTKVLSVLELEDLFVAAAPDLSIFAGPSGEPPTKLVVGLVGYPNVGKSSTINALLGEKKVSVSSTPGKTKHFQTIHLSPTIVLCDCPGLVFPQFATTKAALVCDGVLPIDQMREHSGPTALVAKRIPKEVLEASYGLTIKTKGVEEGGDGKISAEDFLIAYAIARGFMRSGQGNPDEARAARYILKDYVNGKLLFCHPPPDTPEESFNQRTHELSLLRVTGKKRAPVTRVGKGADTFVPPNPSAILVAQGKGQKSQLVDREFFAQDSNLSARAFIKGTSRNGQEFARGRIYPHQNMVGNDGTPLGLPSAKQAAVMASSAEVNGKKHNKKNKRVKQRSGKGYD